MKCYFVDAFAEKLFEGNPAGVCVLEKWLPDEMMQKIAMENNLSETAFTVKENDAYHLRWFTPASEIELCGHATLATAFVLGNHFEPQAASFSFDTRSGRLTVARREDLYELNFPAYQLTAVPVTEEMTAAIGFRPVEAYTARDLLCIFENEDDIYNMKPDLEKVKNLPGSLLHVTSRGKDYDSVSRSFAPKYNVPEDPVCGSGHCHIIPYWAKKLNKNELIARQASERGGTLYCKMNGDRVLLSGKAVLYSVADLNIG